ncbi:MAG TPA: alpha/beta hydrolase-fold protein [Gaiellaceae bacterium]|jgi:enterochelin esterase-like enzyme
MHLSRVATAVALLAAGIALYAAAPGRSQTDLDVSFHSAALKATMHARVVLPAGYADGSRRYPVVYFLHGLPATSVSYAGLRWVANALAATGRPAILVAPQGARDDDTDAEYLDWGAGRNWETYVSSELVRVVDSRFRTIADRRGRAIVGLSAGGYGAAAIGFNHLGKYAAIESWSGYFVPTDPTGRVKLDRGSAAANARASLHTLVTTSVPEIKADHPFFAFYVGKSDGRFLAQNIQLNRELNAVRIAHVFDVYPGGHATALWQRHAVVWLHLALSHLAPAAP